MRERQSKILHTMRCLIGSGTIAACIVGFVCVGLRAQAHDTPRPAQDIAALVTPLKDLQASLKITKMEPKELDKIGKDFGIVYRLRHMTLFYKAPEKVRMEGSSRVFGDGLLISNGNTRFYNVPKIGIRRTENLTENPSKRQSLLEWGGVLSKDTLAFMEGTFVKDDTLNETPVKIYDLRYKGGVGTASHYRVWLDPKTRITLKREWYDSMEHLRATFTYSDPHEIAPGIWLPMQCEVKNSDDVSAATLTLSDVKVDQGLLDTLFVIKP